VLIILWTAHMPTLRTHETLCWYCGIADVEELLDHISRLDQQTDLFRGAFRRRACPASRCADFAAETTTDVTSRQSISESTSLACTFYNRHALGTIRAEHYWDGTVRQENSRQKGDSNAARHAHLPVRNLPVRNLPVKAFRTMSSRRKLVSCEPGRSLVHSGPARLSSAFHQT